MTTAEAIYGGQEYRYQLNIEWDLTKDPARVICLNPSTATERSNDPTIKRLERWARRNNYGSLRMFNAYAYRSTDPDGLWQCDDPVGPHNDLFIGRMLQESQSPVLIGWGTNCELWRQLVIQRMANAAGVPLHCWRVTKEGFPEHPLYLSNEVLDAHFTFKRNR